jgi:hypothetical protein
VRTHWNLAAGILAMASLSACQPADTPFPGAVDATAGTAAAMADPALVEVAASDGIDGYVARATTLRDALAPGADVAGLRRDAEALMELGATLVPAFVERHPHCDGYLAAALQVRSAWPSLDLDAIERDYHHDGVLPQVGNSGVCYHMKDLVTHPATVLVLLKDARPDYAQARREIDEVLEHAGFVARGTQS